MGNSRLKIDVAAAVSYNSWVDVKAELGSITRTLRVPVNFSTTDTVVDTYTIVSTPPTLALNATASGTVYSYANAKFYITINKNGTSEATANWTLSASLPSGITANAITTGTNINGQPCYILHITNMVPNNLSTISLTATSTTGLPNKTGSVSITKNLSSTPTGIVSPIVANDVFHDLSPASGWSKLFLRFTNYGTIQFAHTSSDGVYAYSFNDNSYKWYNPTVVGQAVSPTYYVNIKYTGAAIYDSTDTLLSPSNNTFYSLASFSDLYITANTAGGTKSNLTITIATDSSGSNPVTGYGVLEIVRVV